MAHGTLEYFMVLKSVQLAQSSTPLTIVINSLVSPRSWVSVAMVESDLYWSSNRQG